MAMVAYDDLVKKRVEELKAATDKALAEKKQTTQQNIGVYNQQIDASVAQQSDIYEDSIRGVERAEKAQLDYNHIDELVARKNLENTMADMGLTDSGLNRGQQTALAVMRGNADAKTRHTAQESIRALRSAIDETVIAGDLQKTAYQRKQDTALSEWYQEQLLTNQQTAASEIQGQLDNGYVPITDADGKVQWAQDYASERAALTESYIKDGMDPREAKDRALVSYPSAADPEATQKANMIYEFMGQGYTYGAAASLTNVALEAYKSTPGDENAKIAAMDKKVSEQAGLNARAKALNWISNKDIKWNVQDSMFTAAWWHDAENDGAQVWKYAILKDLRTKEGYNNLSQDEKKAAEAYAIAAVVYHSWGSRHDEEGSDFARKHNGRSKNHQRLVDAAKASGYGEDFVYMVLKEYDSKSGTTKYANAYQKRN